MKLYDTLSIVFYPTVLSFILSIVFSLYSPIGLGSMPVLQSILTGIFFLSLFPTILILYYVRKGKVDINVSSRASRTKFYLIAVAGQLIATAIFWLYGTAIMLSYSVSLLAVTFAAMVINLKTKISAHTSGISADATALACVYGYFIWPVFALIPVVSFVRYKAKAHSPLQLLVGIIIGVALTLFAFAVFYG